MDTGFYSLFDWSGLPVGGMSSAARAGFRGVGKRFYYHMMAEMQGRGNLERSRQVIRQQMQNRSIIRQEREEQEKQHITQLQVNAQFATILAEI